MTESLFGFGAATRFQNVVRFLDHGVGVGGRFLRITAQNEAGGFKGGWGWRFDHDDLFLSASKHNNLSFKIQCVIRGESDVGEQKKK